MEDLTVACHRAVGLQARNPRIYQASQNGNTDLVHKLQRLLIHSWSAKCLPVRRVTQANQGKKTAGVDGVKSLAPKLRMHLVQKLRVDLKTRPVRRVWIPKPNNPTEKRGLGIPTLFNRAAQMLAKLALEPEWEAKFEPNSYGCAPGAFLSGRHPSDLQQHQPETQVGVRC
jgi:RNA-directed DNA polymerase